ncbi:helix-turn-helix domain containing protein [Primorskyibacter flagellatus]|uniref:Helix-turn-helix domain containing protein n=1 Tax=Primorskyibacter flagellatus TaxID=1387277 RepID=A0A917EEC0_9RHOB|nr:DUF6456 domain-containing protein [Primorskyibacter flagellatus]GGE25055.1 helix-turn-helix domain containing protein [Primorskyibacter flagellatus]
MTHANHGQLEPLPDWVPEPVRHYIAHTEKGESLRALARDEGCHASTMLRQIRQVEGARDDLLIDEALERLRKDAGDIDPDSETTEPRRRPFTLADIQVPVNEIAKEALPALRRLAQPGAVLAVSAEMDRAVIVRKGEGEETHRLGVVERHVAQALALNGWIACVSGGPLSRYAISTFGRTILSTLTARAENRAGGFDESPARFRAAPQPTRAVKPRGGYCDTPVIALARRRDRDGGPFLPPDLVRTAERIQEDFELAHMEPRQATNWDDYLTAGTSGPGRTPEAPLRGAAAARDRVSQALRALGPGLGDVVLECCCRLNGLESAERKLGWSARSGKIVLRIALQRLRQHYDGLKDGGGLIG